METLPLATPGHDMSILGLFMQAGWIVKAVMLGLLAASIWSWGIVHPRPNGGRWGRRGPRAT